MSNNANLSAVGESERGGCGRESQTVQGVRKWLSDGYRQEGEITIKWAVSRNPRAWQSSASSNRIEMKKSREKVIKNGVNRAVHDNDGSGR
ncbi:hypothetical protein NA78x_005217 [Anatilimnocola sp. NA78]|uniref:hypothetical protein n=1 Tax=Anatilimnocola sp. NA78 TaxID=3415683 RepID=UPI003CE55787